MSCSIFFFFLYNLRQMQLVLCESDRFANQIESQRTMRNITYFDYFGQERILYMSWSIDYFSIFCYVQVLYKSKINPKYQMIQFLMISSLICSDVQLPIDLGSYRYCFCYALSCSKVSLSIIFSTHLFLTLLQQDFIFF